MKTWGDRRDGSGRKKGTYRVANPSERLSECISVHVSPNELKLITDAMRRLEVENRSRFMAERVVKFSRNVLKDSS